MAAAESVRPVDVVVGVVSPFLSGPGKRLDLVMPNMFMVDASWLGAEMEQGSYQVDRRTNAVCSGNSKSIGPPPAPGLPTSSLFGRTRFQ